MAILDNAIWLTGAGGTAVSGSTTISENGYSTLVTGTFTANAWDASQGGNTVSEFGAFASSTPITASYDFSTPVENLSFDINHLNDDGGSTYDDQWTIYAYDENGDLIDAATVIAGLTGLVDETVITNPDGSVTIEAAGTTSNDVGVSLAGPISQLDLTFGPGPGGTVTGGSGISDLTFTIPIPDTDGDGITDDIDIDDDGDGILDGEEMQTVTPSTITITFDGDQWATVDNTRWELRDQDGNLIASDSTIDNTTEVTNVSVSGLGDYTFTILDDFGDGLGGTDPASYTIAIDGVVVVDSGPNPNFGSTVTETFTVAETVVEMDTDGDGIADHLDLDADNDGITDNVEAQTTAGYIAPTGVDSDNDGLDDAYDATPTTGGAGSNGLTPVDTDSDGTADYIDTDSDNDGISDTDEAGHGITQAAIDASGDADGDGIADVVDDVVGFDPNDADIDGSGNFTLADTDFDTPGDGSGATPMTADLDFRDAVPCFAGGTLIRTPFGDRSVDTLRPGDLVVTHEGETAAVRWIGTATVPGRDQFAPILFKQGSLTGLNRDLLVSPQHRILLDSFKVELLFGAPQAFAMAKYLVNGTTVVRSAMEMVTYYHIMLDTHAVLISNGAATESFYPGDMSLSAIGSSARNVLFDVFPDLRANTGGYGNTARVCLKEHEAQLLAA